MLQLKKQAQRGFYARTGVDLHRNRLSENFTAASVFLQYLAGI